MSRGRRRRRRKSPLTKRRVIRMFTPSLVPVYFRPKRRNKTATRLHIGRIPIEQKRARDRQTDLAPRARRRPYKDTYPVIDLHDPKVSSLRPAARKETHRCVQRPDSTKAAKTRRTGSGTAQREWKPWCKGKR